MLVYPYTLYYGSTTAGLWVFSIRESRSTSNRLLSRRSFLTKIEADDLTLFLGCFKSCGIDERAKEIGDLEYKIKLCVVREFHPKTENVEFFAFVYMKFSFRAFHYFGCVFKLSSRSVHCAPDENDRPS